MRDYALTGQALRIEDRLPLPSLIIDSNQTITFANQLAADYIGLTIDKLVGKNVYMVLDMSFPSEDTLDKWLKTAQGRSQPATYTWERVKLNIRDNHPERHFDLAASFDPNNFEEQTIVVLFDRTQQYSQDNQAISFIALGVHELRTPLMLLRGYIEVFEEELAGKIDPDLESFMVKMHAVSEQLTAFVNNILNVARVDTDQLELKLQSEDWGTILKSAVEMIGIRAKVRGIDIDCQVAENLPPVGIDSLSMREVINNLVDNAIKYSGESKTIKIETHLNQAGMVETNIQDFGGGIPPSVIPNLFTKFYRDHRNRAQIGGTGLGLYLCKAIITAHGGEIWAHSQEGQGSTFGFTIQPYDKLAAGQRQAREITRNAHGWVKNHSLYRPEA